MSIIYAHTLADMWWQMSHELNIEWQTKTFAVCFKKYETMHRWYAEPRGWVVTLLFAVCWSDECERWPGNLQAG